MHFTHTEQVDIEKLDLDLVPSSLHRRVSLFKRPQFNECPICNSFIQPCTNSKDPLKYPLLLPALQQEVPVRRGCDRENSRNEKNLIHQQLTQM